MEIAQIRREDLREVAGQLLVSGTGKGGKGYTLPVPAPVVGFLRPRLQAVRSGPLWRFDDGRPSSAHAVSRQCNRLLRTLGLRHTLHSLRHRFCTQLYAGTLDLALVQDVARHGSPVTTRPYVATGGEAAAAAMDTLAAALRRIG